MNKEGCEPCPFCGYEYAHYTEIWDMGSYHYYVCCGNCGGKGGWRDTPDQAIAAWNRRVNDDQP